MASSQWGQLSESPSPSQLAANSNQWGKFGFLSQRSVSLVETRSMPAASLDWPSTELKTSQSDMSPTALQAAAASSSSSSSSRYKTELCRSFTENGLCKYGGKCQFAHGPEELRDLNRHPKYKTEPCRTFHTIGFCPYGIRCHFIHNSEEEKPAGSSSSLSLRSHRPPLVRQSFSFAGFPSAPQHVLQSVLTGHTPPPAAAAATTASFTCGSSGSPASCADITDLLSSAFLEMDSAYEVSGVQQCQPSAGHVAQTDLRSTFLPSPDSGYSPSGLSPTSSPSLRQSPSSTDHLLGSLGARSLSYTSLSDQDQDGGSSTSSLSSSESCGGSNDSNGKRLAVFSQLSVP
uniref:mRNA decay activator protein ZFP36 n=1 Tax=Poecilia formosa TaxID=48698 RepID=A0A096MAQ5_POEFO